jgi:hypothetical protein
LIPFQLQANLFVQYIHFFVKLFFRIIFKIILDTFFKRINRFCF